MQRLEDCLKDGAGGNSVDAVHQTMAFANKGLKSSTQGAHACSGAHGQSSKDARFSRRAIIRRRFR